MRWKRAGAGGETCRPCSSTRKPGGSNPPMIRAVRAACYSETAADAAGGVMKTRRDFLKVSAGGLLLAGATRWAELAGAANELPSGVVESGQLDSLPGKLPL